MIHISFILKLFCYKEQEAELYDKVPNKFEY